MRVNVHFDTRALKRLSEKAPKALAFATVNGINETAKLIQKAERENVENTFTVRKAFVKRAAAVIKPFANVKQGRPFAEIAIAKRRRLLLAELEKGSVKRPRKGRRVAVPITGGPARSTFRANVDPDFHIRSFKLKRHRTKTGRSVIRGRQRTFVLRRTRKAPQGGIYQRVGPGQDDIRLIYSFVNRPRLRAVLNFERTARRIARKFLSSNVEHQIAGELRRKGL